MPQNFIEKIVQKYSLGLSENHKVQSGEIVTIQPSFVMTHDNTGAVIPKFKSIGATKLFNPRQVVHTLDHNIQDKSEKNLEKYKKIEDFSNSVGADFYPAGRGIGHQIMVEEGYAFPGTLVVASDSHSNMYGGLGVLGTPIVRTDAASVWATGKTWWEIPPISKVELNGNLRPGVTGKDVIIVLSGVFNKDEVLNHAIEFCGDGIKNLSIDQRLSIANMTTEWGALAGVFPIDEVTIDWLTKRAEFLQSRGLQGVKSDIDSKNGENPRLNSKSIEILKNELNYFQPDENAFYSQVLTLNLSSIEPSISGPQTVKVMNSASDLESKEIKINKAYLVSCVNSRLEDIVEAAKVLENKIIAEGVQFYVAAASSEVQAKAEELGYWQTIVKSGATILPPGCGPCIGLGTGLLEDGEVGISATNRNFKGRMGSPNADAYLASPAVVAESAIQGKIASPFKLSKSILIKEITLNSKKSIQTGTTEILDGFPEIIEGNILFCDKDNMNTDGIYPGKYTYNDDFSHEEQAKVVMENYDTKFGEIAQKNDILVSGYNFGTGSSREQAATALMYRGIQLVIAGTFSQTYKRNGFNNGYLLLEQEDLLKDLRVIYSSNIELTIRIENRIKIDFVNSKMIFDGKEYQFVPISSTAQSIIVEGGLENWVKNRI